MSSIDARPVLWLDNPEHAHPVAPIVLKAMTVSGDFSLRIRRGLKPALWSMDHQGRLFPVRVEWLRAWIDSQFRCYDQSAGKFIACPRYLASWILRTELGDRHLSRAHGLPMLTDEVLELIGGLP
jgi:hypothetical protein